MISFSWTSFTHDLSPGNQLLKMPLQPSTPQPPASSGDESLQSVTVSAMWDVSMILFNDLSVLTLPTHRRRILMDDLPMDSMLLTNLNSVLDPARRNSSNNHSPLTWLLRPLTYSLDQSKESLEERKFQDLFPLEEQRGRNHNRSQTHPRIPTFYSAITIWGSSISRATNSRRGRNYTNK
jgi:hypothetical protein